MMHAFNCVLLDTPAGGAARAASLLPSLSVLDGAPAAAPQLAGGGRFAAAFSTPPRALRPLAARFSHLLGVGDVRLDNRGVVAGWGGTGAGAGASDLELVLRAFARRGEDCIPALLGEFAFVVWDSASGRLHAARDAMGVRTLYYRRAGDATLFSSHPGNLSSGSGLDPVYAADFLLGGFVRTSRTPWLDCHAVPPGSYAVVQDGGLALREYWTPAAFAPAQRGDPGELVEEFRELVRTAVRAAVEDRADVWSQLSGGLDSSTLVSVASQLAGEATGPGLAGTVSIVDSLGSGDETPYSDSVVERWGVPNVKIRDYWAWQDDGLPPPRLDEPRITLPFWARDRQMLRAVRDGGGRVLLSGHGPDVFLAGNMGYVADLVAHGRVREAVRESLEHAMAERQSFWGSLLSYAVLPSLPAPVRRLAGRRPADLPDWIEPEFARATGMRERARPEAGFPLRRGRRFGDEIAMATAIARLNPERNPAQSGLELRYPFLYRPLVEFALRLPAPMRIRASGQKWILREAMKGVLPERVRLRGGKGSISARKIWSVRHERRRLEALLADPAAEGLGWIRADRLRAALGGPDSGHQRLFAALSLETWLAGLSGRWSREERVEPFPAARAAHKEVAR